MGKKHPKQRVPGPDVLEKIIERLGNVPGLTAAYVHGSRVKGAARPDSDLDLALLFHHETPPKTTELLKLSRELESLAGRTVHIGILSHEDHVFAKEVIANGKRVYCTNTYYADTFAMTALHMYADMNESRKNIIESYTM